MADHALQSFLSSYGQGDVDPASIPQHHHHQSACCCGNPACAYLKRNQDSLQDLEQDVRNAAQIGQVRFSSPESRQLPVACIECGRAIQVRALLYCLRTSLGGGGARPP